MSRAFIEKILTEVQGVKSVGWQGESLCIVEREGKEDMLAGFIWKRQVTVEHVSPFLTSNPDFVASIPSGAFWQGDAINLCEENMIGWGGVGTLHSACLSDDPRSHSEKSTAFARRFIRQNFNVRSVSYLNSLLLRAQLKSGREVRIALCDAYDLTSEHVRSSWDEIGPFDAIFKNNPNGRITGDAFAAADGLAVSVIDKDTANEYLRNAQ
jgi:hypothetical protein